MKKTLFTTALACALAIFGFAASAQDPTVNFDNDSGTFSSKVSKKLSLLVVSPENVDLAQKLSSNASTDTKTFGYKKNGNFVSLAQAVKEAEVVGDGEAKVASINLGYFKENDTIQFGYNQYSEEEKGYVFNPISSNKIQSDPGYYGAFNPDSFYQLDFSEDPFNGMVEIYVFGEPLPTPAVTLIVALAAGALFLLYKNRRQRFIQTEQA